MSHASTDPQQRLQQILAGFRGPLPRKPTSPLYFVGLLLTAVVMVLLPLIYIGIIALVGYLAYWHLANNHTMLHGVRGRGAIFVFLAYLAPGICGAIMSLFMLKPLFSWGGRRTTPRSVSRAEEPVLFAVVDRVCELVGSGKPRRIDVDCDINASASFRNGFLSIFMGSDLVLTIGMPLVAGLTLKQLLGVLAHEFGHFSQGVGMRLTYIIRTINFWFLRVTYERDHWDEWLAQGAAAVDFRIGWVLYLAMLCVWLTRKVLWGLMMIGNIVAGFMLRQMEYDADTYETRLVGCDTFEATARQLAVLNLAHNGAMSDLSDFHREGRLVDNLPRLIQANVGQIPAEVLQKLKEHVDSTTTGLTDSHPSDTDRIRAAKQFPPGGLFESDLPAEALFVDFHQTASAVTADLYKGIFEHEFDRNSIHSVDMLLSRQQRDKQAHEAFARFMAGQPQSLRFLSPEVPTGPAATISKLKQNIIDSRQLMLKSSAEYKHSFKEFDECDDHLLEARQCEQLLQNGITPQGSFRRTYRTLGDCLQAKRELTARQATLHDLLRNFEKPAELRLGSALLLRNSPAFVQAHPESAETQRQIPALVRIARLCAEQYRDLLELRNARGVLAVQFGHIEGNEENQGFIDGIRTQANQLRAAAEKVWSQFKDIPYPFDHAQKDITVQFALAKSIPAADAFGDLQEIAGNVLQGVGSLYTRTIARLAEFAEELEKSLGHSPLPEEANRQTSP
jgi:Zn-dependent protease with chaperone function